MTQEVANAQQRGARLALPLSRAWGLWAVLALAAQAMVQLLDVVPVGRASSGGRVGAHLLVFLAYAIAAAAAWFWRPRLVIDQTGVVLRDGPRTRRYAWDDIADARLTTLGPATGLRVAEIVRRGRAGIDPQPERIAFHTMAPEDLVRLILEGRRRWGPPA